MSSLVSWVLEPPPFFSLLLLLFPEEEEEEEEAVPSWPSEGHPEGQDQLQRPASLPSSVLLIPEW